MTSRPINCPNLCTVISSFQGKIPVVRLVTTHFWGKTGEVSNLAYLFHRVLSSSAHELTGTTFFTNGCVTLAGHKTFFVLLEFKL